MIKTSLLFDKGTERDFRTEDYYYQKKILSFSRYIKGQIQPEIVSLDKIFALGLYDNDKFVNISPSLEYTVRDKVKCPFRNPDHSEKKIIYIGPMIKCWGHFITDCMSRMWFFLNNNLCDKFSDYYVAYIPIEGFKMEGNYLRMFQLLGIDESRLVEINKPTIFDEIVVPEASYFSTDGCDARMFTLEYKKTIDYVKSQITKTSLHGKKIYFTNSSYAKTKRSFGLTKIDNYFKRQGFEVIHPERFSLDEQISMISSCEFFASTDGSCCHNSVFLNDGAKAIIIPRGPDLTGYQECLCYVHDITANYIDSTLSIFTPAKKTHVGPLYYYVSEELMSFFGEKVKNYRLYCKENFYDLKKYISYGVSLDRVFNASNIFSQKFFVYLSLMKRTNPFYKIKKYF